MNAHQVYRPCRIKRPRRTKAEIKELWDAMRTILGKDHPQSVRHVFYRLCSPPFNLVEKTENGYDTIQEQLHKARFDGAIPWAWVSDGTRWRVHQQTYDSAADAVEACAAAYRRDIWARTPVYVEIWCESDSIAGVIRDECDVFGVPLMTSRGFSSTSYLWRAARDIGHQGRPAVIYYVGDRDPSGKLIAETINARLREFAPSATISFENLLVTQEQIRKWNLPTKPPKQSSHTKNWNGGGTVEAEAIPASVTRALVRRAIASHLDQREIQIIETAEASERDWIMTISKVMRDKAAQ